MRIAFTLVAFSLMTTVVVCHGLKYTTSLTAISQDFKSSMYKLDIVYGTNTRPWFHDNTPAIQWRLEGPEMPNWSSAVFWAQIRDVD